MSYWVPFFSMKLSMPRFYLLRQDYINFFNSKILWLYIHACKCVYACLNMHIHANIFECFYVRNLAYIYPPMYCHVLCDNVSVNNRPYVWQLSHKIKIQLRIRPAQ